MFYMDFLLVYRYNLTGQMIFFHNKDFLLKPKILFLILIYSILLGLWIIKKIKAYNKNLE